MSVQEFTPRLLALSGLGFLDTRRDARPGSGTARRLAEPLAHHENDSAAVPMTSLARWPTNSRVRRTALKSSRNPLALKTANPPWKSATRGLRVTLGLCRTVLPSRKMLWPTARPCAPARHRDRSPTRRRTGWHRSSRYRRAPGECAQDRSRYADSCRFATALRRRRR
jgi:hypothetical protein